MTHQLSVGPSFKLSAIPKLGQDFRWQPLDDDRYSVVLEGNLIHIWQDGQVLKYTSDSGSDQNDLLSSYFRLCDPIDEIYDRISALNDPTISLLVEKYHPGMRLLRQDPWECMVAYICSPNNKVQRISTIVEAIATELGERIELCGDVRYTFPSCKQVLAAGIGRLEKLNLGLDRHSKIFAAAKRVCCYELDLRQLAQPDVPYDEAKRQLMESNGIGNKVADCICLFALNKTKAFPVDRNIGRALAELHDDCPPLPNNSKGGLTDKQYRDIANWARKRFGKHACYVNQLLFHKQRPKSNSHHRRRRKQK